MIKCVVSSVECTLYHSSPPPLYSSVDLGGEEVAATGSTTGRSGSSPPETKVKDDEDVSVIKEVRSPRTGPRKGGASGRLEPTRDQKNGSE